MRNREIRLIHGHTVDEHDVDVQGPGSPPFDTDAVSRRLGRVGDLQELSRGTIRLDLDHCVQEVVLDWATDGISFIDRRNRAHGHSRLRMEKLDRLLQVGVTVTQVGTEGEERAGHVEMRTPTESTDAGTGGRSLRIVTVTAVIRSSSRHTAATRTASRSRS